MTDVVEPVAEEAKPHAPTVRMPVAPAQPTENPTVTVEPAPVAEKPKRVRKRGKRGPAPMTDEEKAAKAAEREAARLSAQMAEQRQQETERHITRLATIGALRPDLLTNEETLALSRYALATLTRRQAEAGGENE